MAAIRQARKTLIFPDHSTEQMWEHTSKKIRTSETPTEDRKSNGLLGSVNTMCSFHRPKDAKNMKEDERR
jgi:hypothetical protein